MPAMRPAPSLLALIAMLVFVPLHGSRAEDAAPKETQAGKDASAAASQTDAKTAGHRLAPDFCDFEITFPEKPVQSERCVPGGECYQLYSYTMVYDLQTTVDISANCTASTPENYSRYNEQVMKTVLAGMVDNRNLNKDYQIRFTQMEKARTAALTGTGTTGAQEKIYTGQIWVGENSVFTVQAELVGDAHSVADQSFSDILRSIKYKGGKQLPKKVRPAETAKEKNQ